MRDIVIFPNLLKQNSGRVKLNIEGTRLHIFVGPDDVYVDTSIMRDGSSACVVDNPMRPGIYTLYDFRELLEILTLTPREFNRSFGINTYMQLDVTGGNVFIKVNLPVGQFKLESDTMEFGPEQYRNPADMIRIDREHSWKVKDVFVRINGDSVNIRFTADVSEFWRSPIFISYGGQSAEVRNGANDFTFHLVPNEDAYVGRKPRNRYTARTIRISEGCQ